jgi:hypothetical protein
MQHAETENTVLEKDGDQLDRSCEKEYHTYNKKELKQSLYRPGQAHRAAGGRGSQNF